MSKEYRIMLLSEKSGKSYSIKLRLFQFVLVILLIVCMAFLATISFRNWLRLSSQNRELKADLEQLATVRTALEKENSEAALYKQWADRIIYRRLNYEDASERGPGAAGGEALDGELQNGPESPDVDVDEFDVRRTNLEYDFEVSFKLINRAGKHRKLSGYIFLIAGNNEVKPEIYASWPPVQLLSGVPKDYRQGSPFSIRYLKHLKGRIQQPDIGPRYNRLDILAYSEDGNILMKKGFYIERLLQQKPYE